MVRQSLHSYNCSIYHFEVLGKERGDGCLFSLGCRRGESTNMSCCMGKRRGEFGSVRQDFGRGGLSLELKFLATDCD